ncbi:hypothetical protein [Malikia sp.]|uniref:hypothetical protein n=1 Tax=Malikia sp. TaxID=2070706 RepID=UPI002607DD7D|nr:hypothetical protein [Malikia sp.]MDD2730379.1 hypothetical protein [Malikia sp.]
MNAANTQTAPAAQATPVPPTIRQRLEALLLTPAYPSMSLDHLCDLLPDVSRDQVRHGLNYLRFLKRIIRTGTNVQPIYQGVMGIQPTQPAMTKPAKPAKPAAPPDPPPRTVIWPADLQIQTAPTSAHLAARGSFGGVNWANATQRPGCQDHLLHPSRRGDQRVPPQGLISGCVGDLRDKRSHDR